MRHWRIIADSPGWRAIEIPGGAEAIVVGVADAAFNITYANITDRPSME